MRHIHAPQVWSRSSARAVLRWSAAAGTFSADSADLQPSSRASSSGDVGIPSRAPERVVESAAAAIARRAAPSPSATTGTTSTFPGLTRSALVEAAALHTRLATSSATLVAAVGSGPFDTLTVSGILRATSGDAVIGLQLAPVIGAWSGGETLSADLRAFYLAVQATAAEGLSASIRNETAYRAAAEKMIALLGGLEAVDAQLRDVAGGAGVSLAPAR
jgi:hypothetical protein